MKTVHAARPVCQHKDCAEEHNSALVEQLEAMSTRLAELDKHIEGMSARLDSIDEHRESAKTE